MTDPVRTPGAIREREIEPRTRRQFALNDECSNCLEFSPLLMPVGWVTPYGSVTLMLCLGCRLNVGDNSDGFEWGMPSYLWDNLPRRAPLPLCASAAVQVLAANSPEIPDGSSAARS